MVIHIYYHHSHASYVLGSLIDITCAPDEVVPKFVNPVFPIGAGVLGIYGVPPTFSPLLATPFSAIDTQALNPSFRIHLSIP